MRNVMAPLTATHRINAAQAPHRRRVFNGEHLAARVSWYAPHEHMQRHAHDCHQLSLLLLGTLAEQTPQGEERLALPALGVKQAGVMHANDYGPTGALMLGIDLPAAFDLQQHLGIGYAWQWRARAVQPVLLQGRGLLSALWAEELAGDDLDSRLWELLASMATTGERAAGTPPRWLALSCQRLQDQSLPLTGLAAEVGVHPVYFARAFARWMGCAPSVFRVRAQLQRALPLLAKGHALADVAQAAGFSDQAHFSRTARAHSGLTPARLRALLRA